MRAITPYTAKDGTTTYRVRYRQAGVQRSETFTRHDNADTFRKLLDAVGVAAALEWLGKADEERVATFGDWFATWLGQLTGITARTRADYQALHRRYLTELDHVPLTLLSRAHVAAIVNRLDAEGKSRKTQQNAIHMLSACLALAVDEGHIPRNPTKRVTIRKQDTDEHAPRFLTHDEAGALIAHTDPGHRALVTFLLGTGLRWSEATALQARHVDLEAGTVRVERAWKRIPGGQEIGPPKSPKSRRTVNAAVPALVAVAPLLGKPSDLVFTAAQGGPVRHSNFYNRVWKPACDAADLDPRPRIHDTRHSFASWLISDGVGLEAVQDQLGHESYDTTRKLYAHLLPAVGVAAGKSASAAMERVLAQRPELAGLADAPRLEVGRNTNDTTQSHDVGADVQCRGEG